MSALAGVLSYRGDDDTEPALNAMLDKLEPYGPDGRASLCFPQVSLGYRWLDTAEADRRAVVPAEDKHARIAITADARLDNRATLRAALGARDAGDEALILAAYRRWGEACVDHLLGDFAFAIWDARERKLFCARDHMGIRPFYFSHKPGKHLVFASSLGAAIAADRVPRRLDEVKVGDYLAGSAEDRRRTFYRDVRRLPGGHTLTARADGSITERRYWRLDPERAAEPRSIAEYTEGYADIFTAAVRSRCGDGDTPLAAYLSGGLDSSSITCVARDQRQAIAAPPLPTYSFVFDKTGSPDERRYMQAVVDQGGVSPCFVSVDGQSPLRDLEGLNEILEQPTPVGGWYMKRAVLSKASDDRVRVILDGCDGDTTISHGMALLPELAASGRWLQLGREILALSRRRGTPVRKLLWSRVLAPLAPPPALSAWRRIRGRRSGYRERNPAIRADFARRIGLAERVAAARPRLPNRERYHHHHRLTMGNVAFNIEAEVAGSAAHSIEARFPFFDRRLVEYCLSLPSELKLRNGRTRWIAHEGLESVLPDAIRARVMKTSYGEHFCRCLLGADRPRIEGVLFDKSANLADYLDMRELRAAYDRFLNGRRNWGDILGVVYAVTLSSWLSQSGLGAPLAHAHV